MPRAVGRSSVLTAVQGAWRDWMKQYGDVYILPTGPVSSFLVISEPQAAKHVLKDYKTYCKGLVSERPLSPTHEDAARHNSSLRFGNLEVGVDTDVKPLLSHSTTGEFNSRTRIFTDAEKVPELRVVR
eukprot:1185048-Prorocentrum_minimum.AAC.1